jgi:hypothetical protein
MDPIMGAMYYNKKSAETAGHSTKIRIFETVLPGMELYEPKANDIPIIRKEGSLKGPEE